MPRISATIDEKTMEEVALLAAENKRSFSEMVCLLLQQAIKERTRPSRKRKKKADG